MRQESNKAQYTAAWGSLVWEIVSQAESAKSEKHAADVVAADAVAADAVVAVAVDGKELF